MNNSTNYTYRRQNLLELIDEFMAQGYDEDTASDLALNWRNMTADPADRYDDGE